MRKTSLTYAELMVRALEDPKNEGAFLLGGPFSCRAVISEDHGLGEVLIIPQYDTFLNEIFLHEYHRHGIFSLGLWEYHFVSSYPQDWEDEEDGI